MSHQENLTNQQNRDANGDPLDAILLAEFNSAEQLQPSSGFTLSVMDAIHEQATVPPPIPFPWKRILPSIIAILCSLVALLIWAALHSSPIIDEGSSFSLPAFTPFDVTLCWIALACSLTFIAVSMSFRLANRR